MNFPFQKTVKSENETIEIAKQFITKVSQGDVISLNGELGAGKTFFVKLAAGELGIKNVSSPSFSIVNEYYGAINIYHFDFYRLNSSKELYDIGFNDYLNEENAIIFIEWGNFFEEVLPKKHYKIKFQLNDDFSRRISIEKRG